jgi:uncharacterized protein DUF4190
MTEPPVDEPGPGAPMPPAGGDPYGTPAPGEAPYGAPPPPAGGPGYPPPPPGYPSYPQGGYPGPGLAGPARNGMGTAALVLGILALIGSLVVIPGFILGVLALIFGLIGRGRARRGEATNPGAALAGAIMGGIAIAITIILIAIGATFVAHHKSDIQRFRDCMNNAQTSAQQQQCDDQLRNDLSH